MGLALLDGPITVTPQRSPNLLPTGQFSTAAIDPIVAVTGTGIGASYKVSDDGTTQIGTSISGLPGGLGLAYSTGVGTDTGCLSTTKIGLDFFFLVEDLLRKENHF